VTALHVREGDRVRAGQLLVEIDNRDANAHLQKANAGLREAQEALAEVEQSINAAQSARSAAEANKRLASATLNRYQALLERKSVSPQEFDEVKAKYQVAEAEADRAEKVLQMLAAKKSQVAARVDQAKAEIANAQINAGYARITAPASGVVTAKSIEVGATATPGAPLLTIEDDVNYRLEAAVEESKLSRIRLNDAVRVRIDAIGDEELTGTVAEILPAADPASRSYTVKIALPARRMLRPGLYGKARFISGQKQAILVPHTSVVQRGQLTGVFAVDDKGISRLRLVKTGKSYGDRVEILSGLNEGERIVIDGAANVNDGSRVQ
jgi:multidrug efflux pump subunit AcrA (membrane-fusion protein)